MSTTHRRIDFPRELAAIWARRFTALGRLARVLVGESGFVGARADHVHRANGENVVYCGAPGSGLLIDHRFLTPDPTDDPITLSDPGDAHRRTRPRRLT